MGIPDPKWLASRISGQTLERWRQFERRFGPILVHERVDVGAALVAFHLSHAKESKLTDFMPRWAPEAPEPEDAIVARLNALSGGVG